MCKWVYLSAYISLLDIKVVLLLLVNNILLVWYIKVYVTVTCARSLLWVLVQFAKLQTPVSFNIYTNVFGRVVFHTAWSYDWIIMFNKCHYFEYFLRNVKDTLSKVLLINISDFSGWMDFLLPLNMIQALRHVTPPSYPLLLCMLELCVTVELAFQCKVCTYNYSSLSMMGCSNITCVFVVVWCLLENLKARF